MIPPPYFNNATHLVLGQTPNPIFMIHPFDIMPSYRAPVLHHPIRWTEMRKMQFVDNTNYSNEGYQTGDLVIQPKKCRFSTKKIAGQLKSEASQNAMDEERNKENTPSRTRRSMRRSRNKRSAIQIVPSSTRGVNEDILYSLLSEFTVEPHEMYFHGYPELTENHNVRLLKMPFGRTETSSRKLSDTDNSDSDDNSEGTERKCARCSAYFLITESQYLTQERCIYHWGKIINSQYACCSRIPGSPGCTVSQFHVWNGIVDGLNERLEGFKETRCSNRRNKKIFALDCEMCYTVKGLELTRVTMIAFDGKIVYDHFVRPESQVVDYNTRFSGVTDCDVNSPEAKSFKEVQHDILNLVTSDTILIGHALENDLRVLKLLHSNVIDTSILFPHNRGYPFKNSLKYLMSTFLNKEIQSSSNGHDPCEDAISCLELIHFKLRSKYGDSYLSLISK